MTSPVIIRRGKIFEAGSYPDKGIEVTEADLQAMAADFSPVENEIEHFRTHGKPCFLDGHLGRLASVEVKGKELFGEVEVPSWLDPIWEEAGRKCSVVLNKDTKRIERNGMVLNPRVADAAVMAQNASEAANALVVAFSNLDKEERDELPDSDFGDPEGRKFPIVDQEDVDSAARLIGKAGDPEAVKRRILAIARRKKLKVPDSWERAEMAGTRHDTPEGQSALQMHHDMAARAGARCDRGNRADFHSGHEVAGLQAIHDAAVEHGAKCSPSGRAVPPMFTAGPAGKETSTMTLWEKVKAALGSAGEVEVPEAAPPPPVSPPSATMSTEIRVDPEVAALKAKVAAMEAEKRADTAAAFAAGLVREGKILPAEAPSVAALFSSALEDDAANPREVTFGEGKTGGRADALRAAYEARPSHILFDNLVQFEAPQGARTVGPRTTDATPEDVEAEAALYLATTAAGQAALARKANGRK